MKKTVFIGILGAVVLCIAIQADAITLGFEPAGQNVNVGNSVEVALTISGLEDFKAPSLGTFDVDVTFDSAIIAFNKAVFGDPLLGDQLDLIGLGNLQVATPGTGIVNLFELSFDSGAHPLIL